MTHQRKFATREAYVNYLANNPNNESEFFYPMSEGAWIDAENGEAVSPNAREVRVRSKTIAIPAADECSRHGVELEEPPRIQIFELCRYIAGIARDSVLATAEERRINVPPELSHILQLEEWHHPNVVALEHPSETEAFRQLAQVLANGDVSLYRPSETPNTHWRNWPDGGTL